MQTRRSHWHVHLSESQTPRRNTQEPRWNLPLPCSILQSPHPISQSPCAITLFPRSKSHPRRSNWRVPCSNWRPPQSTLQPPASNGRLLRSNGHKPRSDLHKGRFNSRNPWVPAPWRRLAIRRRRLTAGWQPPEIGFHMSTAEFHLTQARCRPMTAGRQCLPLGWLRLTVSGFDSSNRRSGAENADVCMRWIGLVSHLFLAPRPLRICGALFDCKRGSL